MLYGTSAIGSWRLVLRSGDERKSSIDGPVGGGLELQRQREHRGQVRTAPALRAGTPGPMAVLAHRPRFSSALVWSEGAGCGAPWFAARWCAADVA